MKAVLRNPIALIAVIVLGFVLRSFSGELHVEINEAEFAINAAAIPLSPEKQHFDAALGKPSRIDKKVHGTIYVYDDLGITYRTDVDSDRVTDISFYRRDMSAIWSYSPRQRFKGSLKVAGREFPLGKPITEVMQAIPEMKPDPSSFGYWLSRNSRENRISSKGHPNISNGLA